ncbi:DUF3144 domain-containing protein [uncultured Ferrimonas sp.]|uniref:DUF3144 domain-containing protein n=1 Tax=uncultured Ferrimonas sp. TaxID=432640 RepID=UPI00262E1B42|nr:DUF3144 domain-containing protein [uncultured Ferrimonas sp.]
MSDTSPFYSRANEFIQLANQHNSDPEVKTGEISASFMYALSRYNAWLGSTGFANQDEMKAKKAEMSEYFIEEYRKMLDANLDDYIENFDAYRQSQK